MRLRKHIFTCIIGALSLASINAMAQSSNFTLGQWIEIHNSILKELSRSYVDTLPINRIMKTGTDAMLENLDPYTIYIPEEDQEDLRMMLQKAYGGIGAIVAKRPDTNVIINEPYINSPAYKSGLVCGDEIVAIDGEPTIDKDIKVCTDKMKGKPGTTVVFTVKKGRTGEIVDIPVVRERIHLPDVEYAGMLDDTTGYILQTGFTENVSSEIKDRFLSLKQQGMKRLVLDLRGNGGGLMSEAVNIVSLFIPRGSIVVTAKGNTPESYAEYKTTTDPIDTEIPIIVLINSGSASSSEIVSGALQDYDRAVIMGKRSYGKGLVQSIRPVAYNGQLKVTTAKYYTPSGRCVQAIDYARRNEDGSVGHIPDSLTKEFRTAGGRIVRDGGGISPDVEIESPEYSRIVYSLVLGGVIDNYVIDYSKRHDSIPALKDWKFDDQAYEDFITFAKEQEFDYRSGAMALYDAMKKELEKEGLAGSMTDELEAMGRAIEMDKEKILRIKKEEIKPIIEEEIAVRYFYHEAGIEVRLRYDNQLNTAINTKYNINPVK